VTDLTLINLTGFNHCNIFLMENILAKIQNERAMKQV